MAQHTQQIRRVEMHPPTDPGWLKILVPYVLAGLVLVGAIGVTVSNLQARFEGRIYPGVTSMGVELGGYTPSEAQVRVNAAVDRFQRTPIVLRFEDHEWAIPAGSLGLRFNAGQTVDAAFAVGRSGSLLERVQVQLGAATRGVVVARPEIAIDRDAIAAQLTTLAAEIDRPPVDARLELKPGQRVVLVPEQPGQKLDVAASTERIVRAIHALDGQSAELVTTQVPPGITQADLQPVKGVAETMLGAPVKVQVESREWELTQEQIAAAMRIERGSNGAPVQINIDDAQLQAFVEKIDKEVARAPRNPRFEVGPSPRMIAPGVDGRKVALPAAIAAIRERLTRDDRVLQLPMVTVKPSLTEADAPKLANLQKVEQASTVYGPGMAERMYNVELAMSRLDGTVIAPGETFSFNDAVGEVSYRTGYKRGFGITQSGGEVQTIPSEGGGICQVATTVFQSIFWAGYPIVERNWHLYWIPRYGQPPRGMTGLDATIDQVYDSDYNLLYAVDLQFTNNTDDFVVIQARTNGKDAIVSLFGKKPDWTVQVDKPVIDQVVTADRTPVHQTDASMAPGSQIMIESAHDGFRATIERRIVQNDEVVRTDRFTSTYKPARNVYLVGPAKPAAPTPTPAPKPQS